MKTLTTGEASTLGNLRQLVVLFMGEHSAGAKYLDEQIAAAPAGKHEEVLEDEIPLLTRLLDISRKQKA